MAGYAIYLRDIKNKFCRQSVKVNNFLGTFADIMDQFLYIFELTIKCFSLSRILPLNYTMTKSYLVENEF